MHELLGRAGIGKENDILFREMDLEIEIVDRHPVPEVAVKAVGLFDQDRIDRRVAPQIGDHLVEMRPPGRLGGLDVDIFADDPDAVLLGIALEELHLGVDREALAILLLGGHSRIQDGAFFFFLRALFP